MRMQKPVMLGFRAAPCFLAHEEPNAPKPQRATQSFCSHYIMESVLKCWCLLGIAGSSPYAFPRIAYEENSNSQNAQQEVTHMPVGFYRHLAVIYLALWGEKRRAK